MSIFFLSTASDLDHLSVPFGGDQLTRVRLQGAKSLRAGAHSANQRFDHLHPVIIEMFHTLQDFLEVSKVLNLSQTTSFRLFQTKRVC